MPRWLARRSWWRAAHGASIAVGIRGATRGERFGAWIDPVHIDAVFTPEALCAREPDTARADLPAFALLRAVAPILSTSRLVWGPAGSAGFELASGVATITLDSDLDLIVRTPEPLPPADAAALFDKLSLAAH